MKKAFQLLQSVFKPVQTFGAYGPVKTLTIGLMLFFMPILTAVAQSLQGVYMTSGEEALIALRAKGTGYEGRLTDGKVLYHLQGSEQDGVLTLTITDGKTTEKAYAAPDGNGSLVVTDERFNVLVFQRSEADIEQVLALMDQQAGAGTASVGGQGNSGQSGSAAAPKGSLDPKYAGRKFLHLYTGNGYTEKWAYYLFEDGRFVYRSSSGYTSSNAYTDFSAAGEGKDAGRWAISRRDGAEYLELSWNDGNRGSLLIEKATSGYLLNGKKYFLVGLDEYE